MSMVLIMSWSTSQRRRAVGALAVLLVLSACSSANSGAAATASDAAGPACPVSPVKIVASVDQWGALVRAIGGRCATITTVVTGASGDPHDYEPTPADIQAFADAKVVVVNGLGYDEWARKAAAAAPGRPVVVEAGMVGGRPAGANPHVWYSPTVVGQMTAAVTAQLIAAGGPASAGYFAARRSTWDAAYAPVSARVEALRSRLAGRRYAATESVYAYALDAVGLVDETPLGYRQAATNEAEPAPADVQAFTALVHDHGVDLFVFNTQTSAAVPDALRAGAVKANVPVLEVTETMPASAGGSLVTWQLGLLDHLAALLAPA